MGKEASPAPTKEASPAPEKETSPEPMKETSPAPAKDVEPIGAVEELKAEVNALLSAGKVEEAKEEQDVVDIVKAAKEAFVAEVIPDNADIDVVPDEGEEVIEYTLNAADAIPIGAIAVATFA